MDRILLYVPFEETQQARSAGATRDPQSKCWYIRPDQERRRFLRWLRPCEPSAEYTIESDHAYVVVAATPCWRCGSPTQVICVYCKSGEIRGQTYRDFTVSNVTALEPALRRQLAAWPNFRIIARGPAAGQFFANHCDHCRALQDDYFLHCEPGGVFFAPTAAPPGALRLVRIAGRVRLSGDEGFEPG